MLENWLELFDEYYKLAKQKDCFGSFSTSPVVLVTSNKDRKPSCRMVLVKSYDKNGLIIYTNMNSKKGRDLQENPNVALCFYWPEISKEILIEGKVELISNQDSDEYFSSRPFLSKVGAHASKQSNIIKYPAELLTRISFYILKYLFRNINRPEYWKGFRVIPKEINFSS